MDLTAVPGGHQPRNTIQDRPEVVTLPQSGLPAAMPIRTGSSNFS